MAAVPLESNVTIRELKPGMKSITLCFIVLDIGRPNKTKDGHEVRTCRVADKTAAINMSMWDEPGQLLQSGDICRLSKGYTSLWKGCLTLYMGKGGEIIKIGDTKYICVVDLHLQPSDMPEQFLPCKKLQPTETPFMSEPNTEHMQNQQTKLSEQQRSASPPISLQPSGSASSGPNDLRQSGGNNNSQPSANPAAFHRNNRPGSVSGGSAGGVQSPLSLPLPLPVMATGSSVAGNRPQQPIGHSNGHNVNNSSNNNGNNRRGPRR